MRESRNRDQLVSTYELAKWFGIHFVLIQSRATESQSQLDFTVGGVTEEDHAGETTRDTKGQ